MQRIKGMVQVGGSTFRIERIETYVYDVIRIHDDKCIGRFCTAPLLAIVSSQVEPAFLQEIARAAVQGGKTSWARRLGPS